MIIDNRKLPFFLPNLFTALNLGCGFAAIMLTLQQHFYLACIVIILGALFDMVDGRIARLTGTQSPFGEQFDSMSDVISFGMAPAFIFYHRFLIDDGRLGMVFTFLYILAGALRLARFNSNIEKVNSNYFQGLPIPGAATAIIGMVLLSVAFPGITEVPYWSMAYLLFYAILMISNFPFPSFKDSAWVKKHKKQTLALIFIIIISGFLKEEIMILFWITLYVIASLIYYLTHRGQFSDIFNWKNEEEEIND